MWKFVNMSYKYHIVFAIALRFLLIVYGEYHDNNSEVPFTDVDYKVFTDASRHVLNSHSPYERHTYRYSPILAIVLTPNIFLHNLFGKILFSFVDIFVGLLIYSLVQNSCKSYTVNKDYVAQSNFLPLEEKQIDTKQNLRKRKRNKNKEKLNKKNVEKENDFTPNYCMLFWLYNPMSFIISSRGNCDSIAVFLVLITLYYLEVKKSYFLAGLTHGLSVHFRLYPVIYSLTYFMYLSEFSRYDYNGQKNFSIKNPALTEKKKLKDNLDVAEFSEEQNLVQYETVQKRTIFKKEYLNYLLPNKNQIKLILGAAVSVTTFTSLFYLLYGYKFLYETYIYHLIRKDTRHNFSLFFYLQYLTAGVKNIGVWQKVLCLLPQLILILVLSVRYGLNKFTLHFSILTQTIIMVSYNSVLTSQYFVWIFGILPLVLWQFDMTLYKGIIMAIAWFVAQLAWLLPAYLLEFHGRNTFLFIWLQGVSFFCVNMTVLGRLIKSFMYRVE